MNPGLQHNIEWVRQYSYEWLRSLLLLHGNSTLLLMISVAPFAILSLLFVLLLFDIYCWCYAVIFVIAYYGHFSTFSLGQKVGWGNDQSEALQRERRGKIGGKGANQVPHPDEGLQQLCWAGTAHLKYANSCTAS